ncbi:hypothetical protein GINT2_000053 [Glugoides intestinalis]
MRYNENNKRPYCEDEFIDLPFLLNAPRVLSELEFTRITPLLSYSQYFEIFLKRKIADIFQKYSSSQWFKDRYLNPSSLKNNLENKAGDFSFNKALVIRNISANMPFSKVIERVLILCPEVQVQTSQAGHEQAFNKTLYIPFQECKDPEMALESLKKEFNVQIIDLEAGSINENILATMSQAKSILRELEKYEKSPQVDIKEASIESYSKILGEKFNFCLTCCKKFDNPIERVICCKTHSRKDFSARNLDILGFPKNLDKIKFSFSAFEEHYLCTTENNFDCRHCEKVFSAYEHVITHISNKHADVARVVAEKEENFSVFLSNIDFFLFELALGIDIKTAPYYAKASLEEDTIVYDLPCIFSGEIRFD